MRKWLTGLVLVSTLMSVAILAGCKAVRPVKESEAENGMATPTRSEVQGEAAPASTLTPDGRPVVVCFGDSLTAGYGVDADESYPTRLQADLDHDGYRYRVVNMGISGETTKDGLSRVDRVLAVKPAVVVVEFGGNDGLRGIPVANSRANLDAIVARLQTAGIKVMLAGITLPPQFSAAYIKDFDQTYSLIAKKYSVPLYPFLLKDVYGVAGSIQPDGIHPTAQGCRQVAKNIAGFIEPVLKK